MAAPETGVAKRVERMMTPERWKQIKEIFDAALKREHTERTAFLLSACGRDEELRREVESLIASHERPGTFIDSPAYEVEAESLVKDPLELKPGTTLASYEIISFVSRGGMGEVYRARDTRLDRTVAIKVLPHQLAARTEVRERFDREARAIARLSHPHICVLYDVGHQDNVDYLVMEYLEGETLADRLARGPLPLAQVMQFAVEIADALDKAHRNGITHRDLKPGNIMLTKSGTKLLDFGLAKLRKEASVIQMTGIPTVQAAATAEGTILGTVQYMAPEQVEAREADARTDIFAFGLVVYEMATGKKAFEGKTSASVMAKILESEPPLLSSIQPMTPPALDRIIKTCLAKDPDERWQSAADLRRELKWIEGGAQVEASRIVTTGAAQTKTKRAWLPWALAGLFFATTAAAAAIYFTEKPAAPPPLLQFQVRLPDKVLFEPSSTLVLSPDGRAVAFNAVGPDSQPHIWLQNLDGTEARPLTNTDIGNNTPPPFWSPDSQILVYSGFAKVRKVNVSTGLAQDLCDKPGPVVGGSWNSDGVIIFGSNNNGLWKTTTAGAKPVPLTVLDTSWHEREHELPQFLPDGRHFLYLRVSDDPQRTGIYAGSIDDPPERQSRQRILDTRFGVTFLASPDGKGGRLFSLRDGTVTAQSFDPEKLRFQGDAVTAAERVNSAYETPHFGASSNFIVYRQVAPALRFQLTWMDDQGKRLGTLGESSDGIWLPALSPDGTRVAFARGGSPAGPNSSTDRDIWLLDVTRGVSMRFTFGNGDNTWPSWSPDGREIVFASNRGGPIYNLYRKPVDGSKPEQLLLKTAGNAGVTSWSADGQFLLYDQRVAQASSGHLWTLPLKGDAKPIPLLPATGFDDYAARISPDGRWVAYSSNETGQSEIYVTEFTGAADVSTSGSKLIISKDGGGSPMWRKDGKELWFLAGDQVTLMAVSVDGGRGGSFQAGVPHAVFRLPSDRLRAQISGLMNMAYTADLKRFLVALPVEQPQPPEFTVLVNWASGSKSKSK